MSRRQQANSRRRVQFGGSDASPVRPRTRANAVLIIALAALGPQCLQLQGTTPVVNCASDAECEKAGEQYRFCVNRKCVECLTATSCGPSSVCDEGLCYARCRTAKDCPPKHPCQDGFCARP